MLGCGLATALLLEARDKVSDADAQAGADFDIRWRAAAGIGIRYRPFANSSTVPMFRARLIFHNRVREGFEQSLNLARER